MNVDCLSVIASHCDVRTALNLAATSKENWKVFGFRTNRKKHEKLLKEVHDNIMDTELIIECYGIEIHTNEKLHQHLWDIGAFKNVIESGILENMICIGFEPTITERAFRPALSLTDLRIADIMFQFPDTSYGTNYAKAFFEM